MAGYSSPIARNNARRVSFSSGKIENPPYHPGAAMTGEINSAAMAYSQNSHLAIIESLIDIISRKVEPIQTLKAVLPYAMALTETEVGALLVVDIESHHSAYRPGESAGARAGENSFVGVAWHGLPSGLMQDLTAGELAYQLAQGQPIYLKPQALSLNPQQALLGRHKLKYLFGLPLQNDEILGAIIVGSSRSTSLLQPELQQRLTVMARLVTIFLENTRLRVSSQQSRSGGFAPAPAGPEQASDDLEDLLAAVMSAEEEVVNHNRDLGLLNAISSEVGSTLQLSAVLQKAIERTRVALDAEAGWIYFLEDEVLTLAEHQGLSSRYVEEMKRLRLGDGVEGMAFSRNEPFLRDALLFHSGKMRAVVEAEKIRAVAAVPLRSQGKPFGVLAVANHSPYEWSSRDERMLMSIGQQVAQATINSQQFAQAQSTAQSWESNYNALQQANRQLARRAEALENQIQELQRIEQQIWTALAASQASRRRVHQGLTITDTLANSRQPNQVQRKGMTTQVDKKLAATLRKVLESMKKEK